MTTSRGKTPPTTAPASMSMSTPTASFQHPQSQLQPQGPQESTPFPPPQTFTFLPQLYSLISRLTPLHHPTATQANGTPASAAAAVASRASRSPTLTRRPAPTSDSSDPLTLTLTATRSREEAIDVKELPALVYPIKQQIERAREVARALPGVEMGIEEQEREIKELERRVGVIKERIGRLGVLAGKKEREVDGKGDVVMLGVEDE